PGCVNTTEVDIKKSSRMRNPHKTRKSVYGLQNDIRSHSPTHTPVPETKPPTEDELHQEVWKTTTNILLAYTEQYLEYDPFLVPPDPSNPWISDDTAFWELEASKEPGQQRVKRWGFGMDEALKDPVGREQFLKFLESEFSSENLRKYVFTKNILPFRFSVPYLISIHMSNQSVPEDAFEGVSTAGYTLLNANIESSLRKPNFFFPFQEHIYKLMKSDSYPRFIRSSAYQELLQAKKKLENTLDRRTSFEKFTRNVGKSLTSKRLTSLVQSY
ncbi:RGS7 protein, partial [Corythaeola cristata]|nr:RGS7 protein [Corythaeola cristata]